MGAVIRDLSHQVITNSSAVRSHFFAGDPEVIVIGPTPKISNQPDSQKPIIPHISLVASLNPGKGADVFLLALASLKEQGLAFTASLRGSGSKEREQDLKDKIKSLGLEKILRIEKSLRSLDSLYSDVSIVVVASINEAFGRVPFEATMYSCAVVYSRSGGIIEYMSDGITGLAFDPNDQIELSEKLRALIENPDLVLKVVSGAKESLLSDRRHATNLKDLSRILSPSDATPRISTLQSIIKSELTERDSLITERDSLITERDSLITERDSLITERDSLITERDSLITERDSIIRSNSWKVTKPLRVLRKFTFSAWGSAGRK
jgi:hypothetical protein